MKQLTKNYPMLVSGDRVRILRGCYINEVAVVVKVEKSQVKLLTLSGIATWFSRDSVVKM